MAAQPHMIPYHDFSVRNGWDRSVAVVYTRRYPFHGLLKDPTEKGEPDGWHVQRADNNRVLGWVIPPDRRRGERLWVAYAASGAFRGADINDEGDVMDEVSDYLTRNGSGWNRIRESTRELVTHELIAHLSRQRATALGYGRAWPEHVRVWRPAGAEADR